MRDVAANATRRARVSKDEDGRLDAPHASRRHASHASVRALRELPCAARLLSMRAGEGGHWWPHEVTSFVACGKYQPADVENGRR